MAKVVQIVSQEETRRRSNWVYSTFPIAIATGPLGTLVTLYLIQINGNALGTIYASVASAIFNGVSIPAALFWGVATDRLHKRRALIALSYGLMGLVLVSFYLDRTSGGIVSTYAAFSFVSVASATPLNLLIMETQEKGRWSAAFARLSMVSSAGNVAGLILSVVVTGALPEGQGLTFLFIPLGVCGLISAGLAVALIPEPKFVLERETVALRRPSFFSRLLAVPVFFLNIPRTADFKRAFRGLSSGLTSYVPLFYISTILFYFSSGLFNTSLAPAMEKYSISSYEILGVILAGMTIQTFSFQGAGRYIGRRSLVAASVQALLLRGWSYVVMGASFLFITGPSFIFPALILYPLGAGIAFALYYTSSNTMMFNIVKPRNAGASLGVYSTMVGIAAMAGSFVSGFISVYIGFEVTFVAAGIVLFAAVGIVARLPRSQSPEAGTHQ
jgi:MFS family permease